MDYKFKWCVLLTILAFILVLVNCDDLGVSPLNDCPFCNTYPPRSQAINAGDPYKRGGGGPKRCCRGTVSDYFQSDQFENIFSNRNSLEVEDHANTGFLNYQSFITASALFQPYGFGTTYINSTFFGTKEVAAFLAHVATKTSCEYFPVSVLCCVVGLNV